MPVRWENKLATKQASDFFDGRDGKSARGRALNNLDGKLPPKLPPNALAWVITSQYEADCISSKCKRHQTKRYKKVRTNIERRGFQDRCLKPLGHPSNTLKSTVCALS